MKWGFVINPKHSCVTNKMIEEKQFTIVWHVDDLKVSHQDRTVVEYVIDLLELDFKKEAPLQIPEERFMIT